MSNFEVLYAFSSLALTENESKNQLVTITEINKFIDDITLKGYV